MGTASGEFDEAMQALETARLIWINVHGEKHPDVALCYDNIGAVYKELGDNEKSIESYENALAVWIKVHGEVGI